MQRPVTKAIIPVAGMGTRFLPATKAQPKEMLPIVDKPLLQYLVEDMVSAGIKDIIFVTAIGKRAIEDHFDRNFELEYRLEQRGKLELLEEVQRIGKLANYAFVRQPKPLGDGHAVLQALPFVDDDEAVMVMFGDDLVEGIARDLVNQYEQHGNPVLAGLQVPDDQTHRYGIMGGTQITDERFEVNAWVEKPEPGTAPSNLAWPGPAILTKEILDRLRTAQPSLDGEIRLANAYADHFAAGGTMDAYIMNNVRFDCGNKLEYIKAQLHFGLQREDLKDDLMDYIRSLGA